MSARSIALRLVAAMSLLAAVACGDDSGSNPDPNPGRAAVASVQLDQSQLTLAEGATRQLAASPRDARGLDLADRPVSWTSSDESIASVSSSGLVSALREGTAVITATSEGVSGRATLQVTAPLVASVEIDPPQAAVAIDEVVQLTAIARGANGIVLNRPVAWSSSNPAVVTVNASGRITGRATGIATVTATVDGRSRSATVSVYQWVTHALLRVNGAALPTRMVTTTVTRPDGSTYTVHVDAHHGQFRLGNGRFEHVVGVWLYPSGGVAEHATYGFQGIFLYDMFSGDLLLYPDGMPGPIRAVWHEDGTLRFRHRVEAGAQEVEFAYSAAR